MIFSVCDISDRRQWQKVRDFYFALKRAENSLIDPLRMHRLIASKYMYNGSFFSVQKKIRVLKFFCPSAERKGKTQNTEKDLYRPKKCEKFELAFNGPRSF